MSHPTEPEAEQAKGQSVERVRDTAAVLAQLGRPPRGRWLVARRCACGNPQVIQTEPRLEDGTPFPTMWWLTCSRLSSQIGRLESSGWMARLNRRLAEDPALRAELVSSIARYIARREEIEHLESTVYPGGGPDRVKCLHAHTAHQLVSGDNPVGALVLEELDWSDPGTPCVNPQP